MRILTAVIVLALLTAAAGQSGWPSHPGFTDNETVYLHPTSSNPTYNSEVAWVSSPTELGETLLGYAYELIASSVRTTIRCEQWEFDGVMAGSLVFTVTAYNTVLVPSDFVDKLSLDDLSKYPPRSLEWIKSLRSAGCNSRAAAKANSGDSFYEAKTLYVPLASDQAATAVLTRPWASGAIGLCFDRTTNALTVTSQ